MTVTTAPRYFTSDRIPQTALDLNAIEAICACGTYLFYDVPDGRLDHALACEDCHDPRAGESDPDACDRPHACGEVVPVGCNHPRCSGTAAPHETEGICQDDLTRCCGCCQPNDYDPNDDFESYDDLYDAGLFDD